MAGKAVERSSKRLRYNERVALVCEDEPAIRSTFAHALRQRGYRVFSCGDGIAALTVLELHHVDVVVSDLYMPGPTGDRVLERAHELESSTRLVLISGWISAAAERRVSAIGARILDKPVSVTDLYEAVGG